MTHPTTEQPRKPIVITVNGKPYGVHIEGFSLPHVIKYTLKNGAHIIERDRDEFNRTYVLAWHSKEWVVWRELPDGSVEWGQYFGAQNYKDATLHLAKKTRSIRT